MTHTQGNPDNGTNGVVPPVVQAQPLNRSM